MKILCALIFFTIPSISLSQDRFTDVEITTIKVSDHIYMLQGAGGNIGVSIGQDGVFMIDDQFAPLSQKIIGAINTISDKPIRFLVNTHFHGDHSGGNENFQAVGAVIVAQDNARKRLAKNQTKGLPVITFSEDATFYQNGDDVFLTHVHHAHTDGDALIYFPQSNVLHTGDTFFNGRFPYIDIKSGGSIRGDLKAAKKGLMLINDVTKIIPGHGPLATKADYKKYHDMLQSVIMNVSKAIASGKSEAEVVAMESLTSAFFTDKETAEDFISGPSFRAMAFQSLSTSKE